MPRIRNLAVATAVLCFAAVPGFADTETDRDALFRLGMMQGHLIVGHELLQAGETKLALPHFGHPVTEIYGDIEAFLMEKRVPEFKDGLVRLQSQVTKEPAAATTEQSYRAAIANIERARQAAPASLRASVPAMIDICSDILDAAVGEYGESIENGRIANLTEYHDSHGYVAYVESEVKRLSANRLSPDDAESLDRFKTVLAKAADVVGPLMPSSTPTASVEDYHAIAQEAHATAAKP